MGKIVIVYWSGTGNTEAMAGAILEGAKSQNSDTKSFNVSQISANEAANYDTLILGCPAMGAEVLEEAEFEPFFIDLESKLNGKNVALFGSFGWGDGEWMRIWEKRVTDAGGKLINREGLMIHETPDDEGLAKCREFGEIAAKI